MCAPTLALYYYSSKSGNTQRFIERLGVAASRISAGDRQRVPSSSRFVLICPTYADGEGRGAVPKPVITFLNDPENRANIIGVIGTGNRNFGETYALSGHIIAQKCKVPLLYTFELAGTDTDIARVRQGLEKLREAKCSTTV